jgi:hypothetical protein
VPLVTGLAVVAVSAVTVPAVAAAPWWLSRLDTIAAWQYSRGGGVTVAVLSTGVDASLVHAVTTGPDFSGSARRPGDAFWGIEGTAVASLITSVAPDARILSLQVTLEYNDPLNSDHAITRRLPDAIASGINYAVEHGARVIDLPLDPGTLGLNSAGQRASDPAAAGGSTTEAAAVRNALARGVVLVAPAGDDGAGADTVNYPAAYPGVIAVGAVTRSGDLAPYSSKRSYVALLAPGSALTVPSPVGGFATLSTTDNAAALVSGTAALIRSRYPGLSVAQVTRAMEQTATSHVADAGRALRSASLLASPAPRPSASPHPSRRRVAMLSVTESGGLASSVVRDAVLVLGGLIVLLGALLIVARTRAGEGGFSWRDMASLRNAPRGSHARRGHQAAAESSGSGSWRGARSGRPGDPVGSGSLGLPAPGGSPGRPRLAPVPGRLRRSASRGDARPPWEPAPPPDGIGTPNGLVAHGARGSAPGPGGLAPPGLPAPGLAGPGLTGPGLTGPGLTGPGLAGPGAPVGPDRAPFPPAARPFAPPAQPLPPAPSPLSLPPAQPYPGQPDPQAYPGRTGAQSGPFAAAPIPTDLPDWSQWNPNASTDAFPAVPADPEDRDPPRWP